MLAHIVGVPVEEALPWLIPMGGLSFWGALALVRSYASAHWRASSRPDTRRKVA